jgi:DNA-binding LacI/PurR family transcriptional regulator
MVEMGRRGAKMLHALIAGGGPGRLTLKVFAGNRLVVRKSTGPPGRRMAG